MLKKRYLFLIMLICLFAISAVSATDNATSDIISMEETTDEVVSIEENQVINQTYNDEIIGIDDGTFTSLQNKINSASEDSSITLKNDYAYDEGFNKNGIIISKSITIDGKGKTIDANGQARIFYIEPDANITLKNLILKNAYTDDGDGGVIYAYNVNLTVTNTIFTNNMARTGGAIYANESNVILSNDKFIKNQALLSGGSIIARRTTVDISNTLFEDSYAGGGGSLQILSNGKKGVTAKFENNIFKNSTATYTAGFFYTSIPTTVINCTFENYDGGEYGGIVSDNNINLTNSRFKNSHAILGGAVGLDSNKDYAIENCTFEKCHAQNGGAIYFNGHLTISNSYFVNNSAEYDGGAMYGENGSAVNCNIEGEFVNNSAINGGAIYIDGSASNCNIDGEFINNAATNTGAIYIDTVTNSTILGTFISSYRFYGASTGGGTFSDIQNLIDDASSGDVIIIGGYYSGSGSSISVNKPVTIIGINDTVLDAKGLSRILTVTSNNVRIENIAFINGQNSQGGAIYWSGNSGVLMNSIFLNNSASWGGAIHWWASNGYLSGCLFENNTAENYGGALYVNGRNLRMLSSVYINNVVTNSITSWQGGGAIYTDLTPADAEDCHIVANSTFISNKAINSWGGALKLGSGSAIFDSNEFYDNFALRGTSIFLGDVENAINNRFYLNSKDEISSCVEEGNLSTVFDLNTFYVNGKIVSENSYYKIDTTLNIPDAVAVYNVGGVVVATLKDTYGNIVSGVNVKIVVGSLSKTAKTNENGQVSIDISSLEPGEYKISARSSATNAIYNEAKATANAIVSADKIDTILTIPDVITIINSPANVVATLKDCYGNILSGINVKIVVGNLSKTAKTNKNGKVSIDISSLEPGEYKISSRSSATNAIYKEAKATANANVYADKIDTILTIPDVTVIGDSPANVVATLKDCYGNILSGINVKIVVGNLSKTEKTDENGQVSLDISDLAPGEYKISARSSGTNAIYNEDRTTANAIISADKIDTILTIPDMTVIGDSPANVVATLKDCYGNILSGINVKIVVGNLSKTAKTNENGQISLDISSLEPGKYKISSRSSATNAIYKEAKATANAIISADKIDTILTIPDVTVIGDSPANVVATLKDCYGNILSGINVKIVVGNLSKTEKTNENGQISLDISSLEYGEYKISARSSPANAIYKEARTTAHAVLKGKVASQLTTNDLSIGYCENATLVVTLKDIDGNAISNATIYGHTTYDETYVTITDYKGKAYFSINNLEIGSYSIYINFEGNDNYLESNTVANILVNKASSKWDLSGFTSFYYGDEGYVVATLKDVYGNPIPNVETTVRFEIVYDLGQNEYYKTDTYITDNYGMIYVNIGSLNANGYYLYYNFAGNNHYASSSDYHSLSINKCPTIFIIDNGFNSASYRENKWWSTKLIEYSHGIHDYSGDGIGNANVKVTFTGKNNQQEYVFNLKTSTGQDYGYAKLNTKDMLPGVYDVTVEYLGNNNYYETTRFYDFYDGNPFYSTFEITKGNPTLTTTGVTTTYGTEAYVKAVLKDPNGNVMANKLVTFNFEDGTGRTVRTDSKGVAQISTSGIDAGTYSITVTYTPESGSNEYDIYNSVSSSVTMKINKANALLYAKSNGYWIINKEGQTVNTFGINNRQQKEIQIYLEDSNGNPIVGKTVYRSGYSSGSVTNSNGVATFTLSYSFTFPYLNPEPKSVTETFTFSDINYNTASIKVPVRVGTG